MNRGKLSSMMAEGVLTDKLMVLEGLVLRLKEERELAQKISILDKQTATHNFLKENPQIVDYLQNADLQTQFVVKSIAAIGEGPIVFWGIIEIGNDREQFRKLIGVLWQVEQFYDFLGGIVGYHYTILKLLEENSSGVHEKPNSVKYYDPQGYQLSPENPQLSSYIFSGISSLPQMAEIYPVGGAGDRLDLRNEETQEPLPAAQLRFCGKTLLEGLIRDLQAREHLYYKLFDKKIWTPILLMTSQEKHNHQHILDICERNKWFGRPQEMFFFIEQPLVPVITVEGHWSLKGPLDLSLKPGGHGVIWKLAKDHGAFHWLSEHKREKALLRQINNPIAGTDMGLLAFTGVGFLNEKAFGFASCPRLVNAAEGMIAFVEREKMGAYEYHLSNIEYTDFSKNGFQDVPESPGSKYSKFPSNTNILFVDLKTIEQTLEKCSLPGKIINCKKAAPYIDAKGDRREVYAGRLESTMQNISDYIEDHFTERLNTEDFLQLKTFITFNERRKTISATKQSYEEGKDFTETPEGVYFEMIQNHRDLLADNCRMTIPAVCDKEEYLRNGPNIIFQYHPALGPLYSIISQKMRRGIIHENSELQLEITELNTEELELDGSLLVYADSPMGEMSPEGILNYGKNSGKCSLRNVKVRNRGIDRSANNVYWKNQITRFESLEIILHGDAEFHAENILFQGGHVIEVPNGYRCIAHQKGGQVVFHKEKISAPTWFWNYRFDPEKKILLMATSG